MKFSFKANVDVEFEVKRNQEKQKIINLGLLYF